MLDRRGDPRFPDEAPAEGGIGGDVIRGDLQRNAASQLDVLGSVDDGHAAAAHELLDPVPGELATDAQGIIHVTPVLPDHLV